MNKFKHLLTKENNLYRFDKEQNQFPINKNYKRKKDLENKSKNQVNISCYFDNIENESKLDNEYWIPITWKSVKLKQNSVPNNKVMTYITSAFIDQRENTIKVIAIGISDVRDEGLGDPIYCHFWNRKANQNFKVNAEPIINVDSHGKKYHEIYFTCILPRNFNEIPIYFYLSSESCTDKSNKVIKIQNTNSVKSRIMDGEENSLKSSQKYMINLTICLSPLNNYYKDVLQFVEWVEFNRLLGVGNFVAYNYSIGNEIVPYLDYYIKLGVLEIIPWRIPVSVEETIRPKDTPTDIHYYGQVAALNDCLYRNMYRTDLIAFIDVDELIIPRKNFTLLPNLIKKRRKKLGSVTFLCTFFRSDWAKKASNDLLMRLSKSSLSRKLNIKSINKTIHYYDLRTLLVSKREDRIWDVYQRSKVIVNPRAIGWVGVHFVVRFIKDYSDDIIENDLALLHHYRVTMWEDDPENPVKKVEDLTALKYAEILIEKTHSIHTTVKNFVL